MSVWRIVLTGVVPWLAIFAAHAPCDAQVVQVTSADSAWTVASAAHVDLWFHAMALLGVHGVGPLPLHSPEYAVNIPQLKQLGRVYPTPLDRQVDDLARLRRAAPSGGLDFVPLYLYGAPLEEVFKTMDAIAQGRRPGGSGTAGASRLALGMKARETRQFLEGFVPAVRDEWTVFFDDYWHSQGADRLAQVRNIRDAWEQHFLPALRPLLERHDIASAHLFVSPALGFEGRVMDAAWPGHYVAAVALLDPPQPPALSIFLFVRELCFMMLSETRASLRGSSTERERNGRILATRCGEAVFERFLPAMLPAYRQTLSLPFGPGPVTATEFAALYSLDPSILGDMRKELFRR